MRYYFIFTLMSVFLWQASVSEVLADGASWRPQSVERLVKLPANYLEKSINHDFNESDLGQAVQMAEQDIGFKVQTLSDIKTAIAVAEDHMSTELRHRLLVEKHEYLELSAERIDLRREGYLTKRRLLESMLNEISYNHDESNSELRHLIKSQDAATNRFEASQSKLDIALFENASITESVYNTKYSENMSAIEKLARSIENHRMNLGASVKGHEITRKEYLRSLIIETEAELAILQQEETILGYMAKLVALDAMALSEETLSEELIDSDIVVARSPANSVDLFITKN